MPSEGRGVGPIAVCPQAGLLAYAELTLQPRIFVFKYPACNLEETLSGELSACADALNRTRKCVVEGSEERNLHKTEAQPSYVSDGSYRCTLSELKL